LPREKSYEQLVLNMQLECESVRVGAGLSGNGVFATRAFPAKSVIGQIKGDLFQDERLETEYTFQAAEGFQLEPIAPFRFLNHSCDYNCDFDWMTASDWKGDPESVDTKSCGGLYLSALRDISPGDELTIDYNWPAEFAIKCKCGAESCRGYIISMEEIEDLKK